MAESAKHLELIKRIVDYIGNTYFGLDYVATLHDLPGHIGCEKPPKIGSYRPDVYAVDAPLTKIIIGEAKTEQDLETCHSRDQLRAFINHLKHERNGILILAVPWPALALGRSIVKKLAHDSSANDVRQIVISEVGIPAK
jgi:hypothetical protein